MRKNEGYRLTDIGDVHPIMPGVQVMHEHTVDEGDLGQNTDEDAESEDEGDEDREDRKLPEAIWAWISAWLEGRGVMGKKKGGAY